MKNRFNISAHLAALVIFSLSSLSFRQAKAQFLGGFFSQQATKKKLMAEQVAGYQLYLSAIKTGYRIADQGLTVANDLKSGTFGLHVDYFNSLQQVTPVVRNDPKGRAIDSLQQQIITLFANEKQWQDRQKKWTVKESRYFDDVHAGLLAKCKTDMSDLTDVLTPGKLQLKDAERLDRLDKIYDRMKDRYTFTVYFTRKCRKLAVNRQNAEKDRQQMRRLYGIQ